MKLVHVAVAVIQRANGDICIAKRAHHQHQGGLWEFPGGKVEDGESLTEALQREIEEELGIRTLNHTSLISIRYEYPDKHVLLDAHIVDQFEGEPHGKEGQPVIWCPKSELINYEFPAANFGILNALLLPKLMAIVDRVDESILQNWIESSSAEIKGMYYRSTESDIRQQGQLQRLKDEGFLVTQRRFPGYSGDTLHLSSDNLLKTESRPSVQWLSASCHNKEEVLKANQLEVDFIFLSPVKATPTHPEVSGIGWNVFSELAELAHMPVYALGGLSPNDLDEAKAFGAQGVAGIRAF